MRTKTNYAFNRAEQVIVDYCLKALKNKREPVRLYHKGTNEHLAPDDLKKHLKAAMKIGYAAGRSRERFSWDYHDEDAETFWSGIATHLLKVEQSKKVQENLVKESSFAFLAKQANCRSATTLLFGNHRHRKDPAENASPETVKLTFSKTFERERWAGDVDFVDTNFPRAVRDLILGTGEKQFAYTADEYDIAARALFEYAVMQYLKMHTNSRAFHYEGDRDNARAYIDKCFREREIATK